MRRRIAIACLAAAIGLSGVLAFVLLRRSSPAHMAESDYAEPGACDTCHADISATYRKTGMGRSFYRPDAANQIEDYQRTNTLEHKPSGMTYTMVSHDGKFFQRRSSAGPDGKEANVVEEQIDYIVGSGRHARTYLHRTQQGRLVELPVSWYTELSGYWAMSPGFDQARQTDIRGAITPECMFCHNGYPALDSPAAVRDAEDAIFPAKLPEGIDCQRCHGPGRAHIAAAQDSSKSTEQIRQTIVNPRRLPRDRQMEVCMECHLGTHENHDPPEIRGFDRTIFSFRPGQKLEDYKLYFDAPEDENQSEFTVAHAAYRLRKSACFLKSQMTCITCHNPHDIPRGAEAVKAYTTVCQSCHEGVKHRTALPASESCQSCHMPKRRAGGSVHVVTTDHYIQRYRPTGDLVAPIPEKVQPRNKKAVDLYYPAGASDTSRAKLYLAIARVDDGDGSSGLRNLENEVKAQSPKEHQPYLELGRAYVRRGQSAQAISWFDAALSHKPDDLRTIRALAPELVAANQTDRAIQLLTSATALYPKDDLLQTDLGYAYLQKSDLAQANAAFDRALALNPENAEAHNLRGIAALRAEDTARAEQSFREALRWQPRLAEARNNLGSLLTSRHEFGEAEFHLKEALAINPEYADAHHSLGLLYILTRDLSRAEQELQAAARLRPGAADVHTELADVLATEGKSAQAADEYERVLALNPEQPDAHLGLGMSLMRQGRRLPEARQHLERAAISNDADASRTAREALQQLAP